MIEEVVNESEDHIDKRRQCGRVVRAPDLESGGPGFKSRSDHYLELFLGSPKFNSSASLVK